MCDCVFAHARGCAHVGMSVYTHTHTHTFVCVCACVCVRACVCVCGGGWVGGWVGVCKNMRAKCTIRTHNRCDRASEFECMYLRESVCDVYVCL